MMCPTTIPITATNHANRAPTIPMSIVYSAVPNRFHPDPNGSDASGMMACPWTQQEGEEVRQVVGQGDGNQRVDERPRQLLHRRAASAGRGHESADSHVQPQEQQWNGDQAHGADRRGSPTRPLR